MSANRQQRMRQASWLIWAGLLGVLGFFILFTGFVQLSERDRIRSGVTVFGVDVGGMTRDEATAALEQATAERQNIPLTLTDRDASWRLTQGDLGFTMDIESAVDEAFATGRSGYGASRFALFWHLKNEPQLVGAQHVAVDSAMIDEELAAIAGEIHQVRIEPELTIHPNTSIDYVNSEVGRTLDVDSSRTAIISALSTGSRSLELTIIEDHPAATDADYEQVLGQLNAIFDSDVTLVADGQTWVLGPDKINYWLTVNPPADGNPASLSIDPGWTEAVVTEIANAVNHEPRSTRVWWNEAGQLVVTQEPSSGFHLNWDASVAVVRDSFTGVTTEAQVDLPGEALQSPALPADLGSLSLSSVIAEASTPYGGSIDERKHNIEHAARLLNGTLVMPGQLFSFNSEIGPMTIDTGFQNAFGIANDGGNLTTVPTIAGGICQVATTVFQPVFVTGYELVQRSTHSYWIQSYTYNGLVGLDSTVDPDWGLDLKWINNSPYPVMIQAQTDGEYFTVRLIGRAPDWSVEILPPEIKNVVEADHETTYYEADTNLDPGKLLRIEHAQNGFDVKLVRIVHDGAEDRVWEVTTAYGVSRNVVLVGSETGELPAAYQ